MRAVYLAGGRDWVSGGACVGNVSGCSSKLCINSLKGTSSAHASAHQVSTRPIATRPRPLSMSRTAVRDKPEAMTRSWIDNPLFSLIWRARARRRSTLIGAGGLKPGGSLLSVREYAFATSSISWLYSALKVRKCVLHLG